MHPVRIGTAGWTIPRQSATEASNGTSGPGSHLERYATVLPCAEINSSFYRPHRPATWARWAASVPADFRFSVKAPKTITHEAQLDCTADVLKTFLDALYPLGEKLGPILVQLPPKLAFDPAKANNFLKLYRSLHRGPTVFEPRHATWFTPEAGTLLTDFDISRAAADPARVPDAATPGGSPRLVYYRLHGSPRTYYSEYSAGFLSDLAATLAHERTAAETWCIFDNTTLGHAFGNALTLERLLASEQDTRITPATLTAVP